jgi:2-oxoglutarate ferredoxin oxidoreductase subunit beta
MTYLAKPRLHHPTLPANKLGFHAARLRREDIDPVRRLRPRFDLGGAGAGLLGVEIEPHRVAKLSGIGCSSKTPDYFLGASHGFNTCTGACPRS